MALKDVRTQIHKRGPYRVRLFNEMALDDAVEAFRGQGELLQRSKKAIVRRVGQYVVKRSRPDRGRSLVRFNSFWRRHRRVWKTWRALHDAGVKTPRLYAYIERVRLGVIVETGNIMEFLDGYLTVRQYARTRLAEAPPEKQQAFLDMLRAALSGLERTQAWHEDLKEDNIFTRDGETFYFLDLDAVRLPATYTTHRRKKSHTQVYFNLLGTVDQSLLDEFIRSLAPPGIDGNRWLERVSTGAAARLARARPVWKRLGLSEEELGYAPRQGR